jgi:hypothetical protein
MQSSTDQLISSSILAVMRQVGSNLLILYGGYNAYNDWPPSTNAMFVFDIPNKKWSWIEGNSTGPAVMPDRKGYIPVSIGVSHQFTLPATFSLR